MVVNQTVLMEKMKPPPLAVQIPFPVIQTFVFQLDRKLYLDNAVETALRDMALVGAATVVSV